MPPARRFPVDAVLRVGESASSRAPPGDANILLLSSLLSPDYHTWELSITGPKERVINYHDRI